MVREQGRRNYERAQDKKERDGMFRSHGSTLRFSDRNSPVRMFCLATNIHPTRKFLCAMFFTGAG